MWSHNTGCQDERIGELHVWPAMRVTPVLRTSAAGWERKGTAGRLEWWRDLVEGKNDQ